MWSSDLCNARSERRHWCDLLVLLDNFDVPEVPTLVRGYGLLTKNLSWSDPLAQCEQAVNAIGKELGQLQSKTVVDFNAVQEWDEVRAENPNAIIVLIKMLIGIKNYEETQDKWIWKARAVAQGCNVTTGTGQRFIESEDMYVLPVGISGARLCISFGYATGGISAAAGVDGAYLEAELKGPAAYGRLEAWA